MRSYSKIFKASQLSLVNGVKVVSPPLTSMTEQGAKWKQAIINGTDSNHVYPEEFQLIEDAKAQAMELLETAKQNALAIEAEAQKKVEQWWEDNQTKLELISNDAYKQAYQEGFEKGTQDASQQFKQQYEGKMAQIQDLLQQAYIQKEAIIAEAEPFLLSLSTAIASQIIKQELEGSPDKFVELIKQHILRFKEKEYITICVHPEDFDFIQSQRAHLDAVVNGETEIKVIPDHTVTEKGCIIRTAYGSVDARIDTQLEEIKKVILSAGRDL